MYEGYRKVWSVFHRKKSSSTILKSHLKKNLFVCCALAIPVIHFLIFWVYVNFNSILLAFQNTVGGEEIFTLDNFREVFRSLTSPTGDLRRSFINTMIFFAYGIAVFPLGLFWAYFMYKNIKGKAFFRVMFYMPSIVSSVVVSSFFVLMVNPDGPIGVLYRIITGAEVTPAFLRQEEYALKTVLIYSFWTGFAGNLLLLGGAMARIPVSIIESANLDGIGMMREMWQICIPLIWPTLSVIIVTFVASIFSASGEILLLTGGAGGTSTINFWLFYQVKYYNSYYVPSAFGLLLTCIALPITLITRRLLNKVYADVEF